MRFNRIKKQLDKIVALGMAAVIGLTAFPLVAKAATTDFSDFPESYRSYLQELSASYPNWTFVPMETGLDWNDVVAAEEKNSRKLVSKSSTLTWRSVKDSAAYNATTGEWVLKDTGGWVQASDSIIKYALDPRNYLNVRSIFIFQQESYNASAQTLEGVQSIIKGTFMENAYIEDNDGNSITYAQAIMQIAAETNLSPYKIAVKIRQEQGVNGTSSLISGTYSGYEGYYNYFNVKASGSSMTAVIVNGLKYARDCQWDTPYKSILGGAYFLVKNYIGRGQDTLYLQDFDVDNTDNSLYSHQYAQNVLNANAQAVTLQKMYASIGCLTGSHIFRIPIYENMPDTAYEQPSSSLSTPVISQTVSSDLTQVSVSWSEISGASGYTLQRADSLNGTYKTVRSKAGLESTTYTDTNITPGKTYYYRVRAYYKYTDTSTLKAKYILSSYSSSGTAEILVNPITNMKVAQSGATGTKVTWTASKNAEGYRIYRSTSQNSGYKLVKTITSRTTRTYTDSGLLPNTTYYYRVRAYKTVNSTKYTSALTQANISVAVATVSPDTVANKVDGTARIKWTANTELTGYEIYRSDSVDGTYQSIGIVSDATVTSFVDQSVVPNTTYYYKMAGIVKVGSTTYLSEKGDAKSVSTRIWKPSMDSVKASGKGSLTVTWTKRANRATGFAVYRSETEKGGYRLVKKLNGLDVTTYTDTGLTSGKTYYYKVRAYMKVGDKTYYSYFPTAVYATVQK